MIHSRSVLTVNYGHGSCVRAKVGDSIRCDCNIRLTLVLSSVFPIDVLGISHLPPVGIKSFGDRPIHPIQNNRS
jgi:hypothetical protein